MLTLSCNWLLFLNRLASPVSLFFQRPRSVLMRQVTMRSCAEQASIHFVFFIFTELLLICFISCILIVIGRPLLVEPFVPLGFPAVAHSIFIYVSLFPRLYDYVCIQRAIKRWLIDHLSIHYSEHYVYSSSRDSLYLPLNMWYKVITSIVSVSNAKAFNQWCIKTKGYVPVYTCRLKPTRFVHLICH